MFGLYVLLERRPKTEPLFWGGGADEKLSQVNNLLCFFVPLRT
jgi:hypothetical protein